MSFLFSSQLQRLLFTQILNLRSKMLDSGVQRPKCKKIRPRQKFQNMAFLVLSLKSVDFCGFQGMNRQSWTWRSCLCNQFQRKTLILDKKVRKTYPTQIPKIIYVYMFYVFLCFFLGSWVSPPSPPGFLKTSFSFRYQTDQHITKQKTHNHTQTNKQKNKQHQILISPCVGS